MEILLTQSYLIERDPPEKKIMRPFPPLGIMYLASSLVKSGHDVFILDNTFEKDLKEFRRIIEKSSPVLVGISAVETTRKTALEMCSIARDKNCRVIAGGPDPMNAVEAYMDAGADWICQGEGEKTLVELARYLKSDNQDEIISIPGLVYRNGSEILTTGSTDLHDDLDSLPLPAWDMIPIDRYFNAWRDNHNETSLSVISSRGCLRNCTWCSQNVFGKSLRRRSPSDFVNELKYLKENYNPDYFWIADDSFTSSLEWLLTFQKECTKIHLHFKYEALGRVDEISPETAEILKNTGCRFIWFGAESGSQRVLDAMKKGFRIEKIAEARKIMADYGIPTGFFIMLGYPPEIKSDIHATAELIRRTKPDKIGVSVAYPIAGTEFFNQVSNQIAGENWTRSGENRPVFKTIYPASFYRIARKLLYKESQVSLMDNVPLQDNIKLFLYRSGMNFLSMRRNV